MRVPVSPQRGSPYLVLAVLADHLQRALGDERGLQHHFGEDTAGEMSVTGVGTHVDNPWGPTGGMFVAQELRFQPRWLFRARQSGWWHRPGPGSTLSVPEELSHPYWHPSGCWWHCPSPVGPSQLQWHCPCSSGTFTFLVARSWCWWHRPSSVGTILIQPRPSPGGPILALVSPPNTSGTILIPVALSKLWWHHPKPSGPASTLVAPSWPHPICGGPGGPVPTHPSGRASPGARRGAR